VGRGGAAYVNGQTARPQNTAFEINSTLSPQRSCVRHPWPRPRARPSILCTTAGGATRHACFAHDPQKKHHLSVDHYWFQCGPLRAPGSVNILTSFRPKHGGWAPPGEAVRVAVWERGGGRDPWRAQGRGQPLEG
jgi:hypothetical protein